MKNIFWVVVGITFCQLGVQAQEHPGVVSLIGYENTENGVTFQVPSGGCLTKADFSFHVVRHSEGYSLVTLLKNNDNTCFGYFRLGQKLSFSYADMAIPSGEVFRIENPHGFVKADKGFPGRN